MKLEKSNQSIRDLYSQSYFDGYINKTLELYSRKEKRFNLEWASAWSGKKLLSGDGRSALDAGCGLGINSFFLKDLGYRVTGIDFSDYAIQHARARSQQDGHQQMDWLLADLDTDSISGFYDLVICWEVIEHVRNPEAVLQKLYATLHPGGILIITTPNGLGFSHLLLPKDPTHIHVHSSFWWAQKLRALHSPRWICRTMMFWDHVLPWLKNRQTVIAHWLPLLGFRIRMAIIKTSE